VTPRLVFRPEAEAELLIFAEAIEATFAGRSAGALGRSGT